MRISTAGLHQQGINNILNQQIKLSQVQNQIASGSKLMTAADNPAGAARALTLDQTVADLARWQDNTGVARDRLSLEENALSSSNDVLNRVRELVLQANSGTQSPESRAQIASQLNQIKDELLSYANADDGAGRYLFAGGADGAPPFSSSGGAVVYNGDQTTRMLAIGAQRLMADGDAGSAVFQQMRSGNGSFSVAAQSTNTGSVQLRGSQVTDSTLWDGGSYSISFNAGNYEVRDAGNALVSSGAYVSGSGIRFRGIEVTLSGTPVDGDRMEVGASTQTDVFSTIQDLISWVQAPAGTAAQRAQVQTGLNQGLSELQTAQDHLSGVRATVGNRLSVLDSVSASLDQKTLAAQQGLSDLRDLDYAEAASRLNLSQVALQAAQQSYMKVQSLSLFDYLR